jgi:hypothetical protein
VGVSGVLRKAVEEMGQGKRGEKASGVAAVKRLHDEIGQALGDRSGSLFMDAYYDVLSQQLQKPEDLAAAAAWAQGENGAHRQVAADFYAGIGLIQTAKAKEADKNAGAKDAAAAAATEGSDKHYHKHFQSLLTNAELPVAWRLHLAALVARQSGERLPTSLGKELITVYTEAVESGVPITNEQQRPLLEWLVRSVKDEELQEGLAAWREKWAKRYLRPASTGNSRQYERFNEISDTQVLSSVLKLYLQLGDVERVNVLLRRYDEQLKTSTQVVLLLLRAEQPELAARFLRAHWAEVELNWPANLDFYYDEAMQAQEAAMCAKLVRDEERFFARTLLASLPSYSNDKKAKAQRTKAAREKKKSSTPGEPTALRPRDARMVALADEFAKAQFNDDSYRMRTLVVLSRSGPASERLGEAIAQQYKKLNLPLALQQDDDRRWRLESELASRHFANEFRSGGRRQ